MPVKYITSKIKWQPWEGPRYQRLEVLQRFYDGTIYDHLPYSFYEEVEPGTQAYIPLRDRRPSVIYSVPRVVVGRSVNLLFGGKHWPQISEPSKELSDYFLDLNRTTPIQGVMLEAATVGAAGSVFVAFAIAEDRTFYEVWPSRFCIPIFDRMRELEEILILFPTYGYELLSIGFNSKELQDRKDDLWFYAKKLTKQEEIVYEPIPCDQFKSPSESLKKNNDRSTRHGLNMVPGAWIRNFPKSNGLDADATYGGPILNLCVEIDYQLSQCGRGLKYNSDPQLLIKEPPQPTAQGELFGATSRIRSASNALIVGSEGDAKLLEISGQGQKVVLEFVEKLRRYAIEIARGSHKDPDKAYGNMSGRAMEILDEELIGLCNDLRLSWGEAGLKPLLTKILLAQKKIKDAKEVSLRLDWGNYFDPTPNDLLETENALTQAVTNRRLWPSEGRALSAQLWGVNHADQEFWEKQWTIPPPVKDVPAMLKAQGPAGMNGKARGGGGRSDASVTS